MARTGSDGKEKKKEESRTRWGKKKKQERPHFHAEHLALWNMAGTKTPSDEKSRRVLLLLCYAPMSFALDRASRQNKELPASITWWMHTSKAFEFEFLIFPF
jgi:hypothetical protein